MNPRKEESFTNHGMPERPLRVLMAVPQYPYPVIGGLERQSHELAKVLLELGVEVEVVSGKFQQSQLLHEVVEGVNVHRIPWPEKKWVRFIRTPFDLLRVIVRRRHWCDVIHLHQFSWFGLFVILLARLLDIPVLTKLPNVGELGLPGLRLQRHGGLKLAIFRKTDAVVAMTKESLAELDAIGFPLERVLSTPNGIRLLEKKDFSISLKRRADLCRVVFIGRLSQDKRIDDLLYAWQMVLSVISCRAALEIWGSGPLEIELKSLCKNLGINDSVDFHGYVEDVRTKINAMDLFVLPSLAEGNSNAILEAMAAGLPIISTRVGGTSMLVGDEGLPFLVEPGDRASLGRVLIQLIEDIDLRERIGFIMYQRVLRYFDIREIAKTYATAYALLAAGERMRIGEIGNPLVKRDSKS